ncbi:MAG: hypothetical protein Sapg2KO_08420 [Saprospiraceae bacterium]
MSIALAFILPFITIAQETTKFGKVSKDHLTLTTYEADTSAVAIMLFDKGDLKFNFSEGSEGYLFERHRRIKILKRPGFDYGDVTVSYYTGGAGEKLKGLKAMVHNPDGSTTKLSKSDFFKEAYNENWALVKFSFPDLQEGSIIEYQYTLNSPFLSSLPEWYFQHDIPVQWSEYNVQIPQWYRYVAIAQGRQLDVSENTVSQRTFRVSIPGRTQASRHGTANLEVTNYHLVMKEVPALKEERYITNMDDYRSRLIFQLQGTHYETYQPYMSTWQEITKELMEGEHFGLHLDRKRNFKEISAVLAPALAKAKTQTKKAQIIYDHINEQIEWNGEYRYSSRENLGDIYERKIGTSSEINLLLWGMLQAEGITVTPALVSTRENGKMIELYPILSQFNHLLLVANLDGQPTLLDAGNNCLPMGTPRTAALNGYRAILLDPNNAQWMDLPVQASKSVQMATASMDEDGMISGNMAEMKKGYFAVSLRKALEAAEAEDFFEKRYMAGIPEIEIGKVEVSKDEDMSKAFKSHVDFTIPNQAMVNGDFIYFTPILDKWYDENPFKLEKRDYPVDFTYPTDQRYVLSMELPEGYIIEEKPEDVTLALPDHGAVFSYNVKQIGTKVALNCSLKINKTQFHPDEYPGLKKFFDLVVEKQNEQLVLKYDEQ